MAHAEAVDSVVRDFVTATLLAGAGAGSLELGDSSDLVDLGVVDSMNVLKLVDFLEEEFDFMLEPEEIFRMTSIGAIADLVREKLGAETVAGETLVEQVG